MKRYLTILFALILLSLSSCAPGEEPAPEEEPVQLESLSVEVPRGDLSAGELAQAVRDLPEALKSALASQGVEAGTVTVSVGSSPAATAQAVSEGGVDLAFLPEADFAGLEDPPRLILAAEGGEDGAAMAAAVRPDGGALEKEAFASALAAAVEELQSGELGAVFGPRPYALVGDQD